MSQILTAPDPAGRATGHSTDDGAPVNGHTARRLLTRSRLLDAATALFAEHGVRAVTSTAIARRAGVATGTFYLHFVDKHALFEELVQEAVREMGAHLDFDNLGRTDDGTRRRGLERMMAVADDRRDLIRAVFDKGETSDLADRIQHRIAHRLDPIYGRLFAERAIGLDPAAAAQARAALIVRMVAWWTEAPSAGRRREVVEVLLAMDPLRLDPGPPDETDGPPTDSARSTRTKHPQGDQR